MSRQCMARAIMVLLLSGHAVDAARIKKTAVRQSVHRANTAAAEPPTSRTNAAARSTAAAVAAPARPASGGKPTSSGVEDRRRASPEERASKARQIFEEQLAELKQGTPSIPEELQSDSLQVRLQEALLLCSKMKSPREVDNQGETAYWQFHLACMHMLQSKKTYLLDKNAEYAIPVLEFLMSFTNRGTRFIRTRQTCEILRIVMLSDQWADAFQRSNVLKDQVRDLPLKIRDAFEASKIPEISKFLRDMRQPDPAVPVAMVAAGGVDEHDPGIIDMGKLVAKNMDLLITSLPGLPMNQLNPQMPGEPTRGKTVLFAEPQPMQPGKGGSPSDMREAELSAIRGLGFTDDQAGDAIKALGAGAAAKLQAWLSEIRDLDFTDYQAREFIARWGADAVAKLKALLSEIRDLGFTDYDAKVAILKYGPDDALAELKALKDRPLKGWTPKNDDDDVWWEYKTSEGRPYYYNQRTRATVWELPPGAKPPRKPDVVRDAESRIPEDGWQDWLAKMFGGADWFGTMFEGAEPAATRGVKFSPEEEALYLSIWDDPTYWDKGDRSRDDLVSLLQRSGLPKSTLRVIWDFIAPKMGRAGLELEDFKMMCRLVGHCEHLEQLRDPKVPFGAGDLEAALKLVKVFSPQVQTFFSKAVFAKHDTVEVFSATQQKWVLAVVSELKDAGVVHVQYIIENGEKDIIAPGVGIRKAPIEVWSVSQNQWERAHITYLRDDRGVDVQVPRGTKQVPPGGGGFIRKAVG